MTPASWPALDTVLAALSTAPSRTGSVIATIYGDAILPRGGALALSDLLTLMHRLGAAQGVVRTAVSRLAKNSLLQGQRTGRRSAYALTPQSQIEFRAASPRIYGAPDPGWDGRLRLAFPAPGTDRSALDAAGYASLVPGVLLSPNAVAIEEPVLEATGPAAALQQLAARTWPLSRLANDYATFSATMAPLAPIPSITPLDAMAARILVIHAWRRIALRDPHLPAGLLPPDWPGASARRLCTTLYRDLAAGSEAWLDAASAGQHPLPPGADPTVRFTSSPAPSGNGPK